MVLSVMYPEERVVWIFPSALNQTMVEVRSQTMMAWEAVAKPLEDYSWAMGDFAQSPQKSNPLDGNDVLHQGRGYTPHTLVVGLLLQNKSAIVCLTRYGM